MKIRSTVILFGIFAAALLIFAAFQWLGVKTGDESKHAERFVFPTLNPYSPKQAPDQPQDPMAQFNAKKTTGAKQAEPKEFSRLVIERNRSDSKKAEKLEFSQTAPGKWSLISPVKVRTDSAAVTTLIQSLIALEKQKSREGGRDLAKFGLDKPEVTVTLIKGDKDYVLNLGTTGPASKDPIYYASSTDWAGKPFLLAKSKIDKVFDEVNNFRDKALISSSFGLTGVKLGGTARSPMELNKDKDWTFKEPAIGEADTPTTDEYTRQLSAIRVERNEDYVADSADAAKLAQYGLSDDKPVYAVTITQSPISPTDKPTVEQLLVGNPDDSNVKQAAQSRTASLILDSLASPTAAVAAYAFREKQKVEPTHYYARLSGDSSIVRIPAKSLPLLKKTADELRAKGLAKIDNSKVDVVNIKTGGELLRIYRPDLQGAASWELFTDNKAKVKAQPTAVQNLLDAISKIEVREPKAYLDDDAKIKAWFGDTVIDLGLDKPHAEFTLWQDGIKRDAAGKVDGTGEPKIKEELQTKPTVKLAIGRKDDQRKVTYVRRETPGTKPVILAVPDPFVAGNANVGAMQAGAEPPDGRQTFSLNSLANLGYLAYRDRSLPSYRMDQISSIEIKRPGVNYLLERTDTKDERGNLSDSWKLKQPVEGAPNTGVPDFIASTLVGTSSDKLITDRASDKDLDEAFGLVKAPLLQVIVKTKPDAGKPEAGKDAPKPYPGGTYTYLIGKKIADTSPFKGHYYARVEAKLNDGTVPDSNQFVIAVPAPFVQSLDYELRNGMVFPEEKTQPVSMQLTWNGETKEKKPLVTSLELKLTNDKWEVVKLTENGADAKAKLAKLDQSKINALLRYGPQPAPGGPSLNPWMVDRFLQHTGAVNEKYRLDPAKAATPPKLVIDVKYSDGKNRNIIIGDAFKPTEAEMPIWAGSSLYYAATPSLPGAVMLLNDLNWRDLVSGVDYFAEGAPKPKQ
ncbi:MAG: DUF4340 domain-containing protein [Gemmatales bacterium]